MTALKDSLDNMEAKITKVIEDAKDALKDVKTIRKSIDKLESAFMSEVAKDVSKPAGKVKRGNMSKAVLNLVESSPKGISINEIKKKTGLEGKSIYGVMNRLKKEKKVKSGGRGVYVKV